MCVCCLVLDMLGLRCLINFQVKMLSRKLEKGSGFKGEFEVSGINSVAASIKIDISSHRTREGVR